MDRYAVFGNPVAHSKSPEIHRLFAFATGQQIAYEAILAPLGQFEASARTFVAEGGKGFNVTLPFKAEAWSLVDRRDGAAALAGAVNTVAVESDGTLSGFNTDGAGLVADLVDNLGWVIEGARLLVLGAGGAAAGILGSLLAERPAQIVVSNRTGARAAMLVARFAHLGSVEAAGPAETSGSFDLVINATSASLAGDVPEVADDAIVDSTCCYDLAYAADVTAFNRWALASGAHRASDGLGMLVEQAARAFAVWRHVEPATAPVIERLRAPRS